MKAKKIIGTILCAAMAITALTGCSAGSGKNKVGVSMPTKDLQEMESGRRQHEERARSCRLRSRPSVC